MLPPRLGVSAHEPQATALLGASDAALIQRAANGGCLQAAMALGDSAWRQELRAGAEGEVRGCQAAVAWLVPASHALLQTAEETDNVALPPEPAHLRTMHRRGETMAMLRGDAVRDDAEELAVANGWNEDGGAAMGELGGANAEEVQMEMARARAGDAAAQRQLGTRYLTGTGVSRDPTQAQIYLERAAEQGDPLAEFNLAYSLLKGLAGEPDHTRALRLFERCATVHGMPGAYNALGAMYWNALGVPADRKKAREYFEEAAAHQDPDGLFNLGTLHLQDRGLLEDDGEGNLVNRKALEAFEQAHEVGHYKAPQSLALAHIEGQGTIRNCTAGLRYLRIFVSERAQWSEELDDAVDALERGESELGALVDFVILAEQGSATAAANAAWLLERHARRSRAAGKKGDTLLLQPGRDPAQLALEYNQLAAERGAHDAWVDVAEAMLRRGRPSDPATALEALQKAAGEGVAEAMYRLGWLSAEGLPQAELAANATAADEWFTKAMAAEDGTEALAPMISLVGLRVKRLYTAGLKAKGAFTALCVTSGLIAWKLMRA